MFLGFPGSSAGKESTRSAGDLSLIPGLERSPGGENGNPLHISCPENPMDRGAWQATVHGVTKSQTGLSDFHFQGAQEVTEIQSQQEVRASCHSS